MNNAYTTEYMMFQHPTNNGQTFETMDEWYVWGAENTEVKAFIEADLTPTIGENLYRIKLTDINGVESFSNVLLIKLTDMIDFAVFPNPTSNFVEMNLKSLVGATDLNITISDWAGKAIQEMNIEEVIDYTERIELNNYRAST